MRSTQAALIALLLLPALGAQGVTIAELTELAKARAAKLRPELEKKLEPHLEPLSKNYFKEKVFVDDAIEAVAALGDSVIPLLLEKLEPRRESPQLKQLAANCARVLGKMDPASFLDALLEIAEGESYTGIQVTIPLLGQTGSPRAGDLLTRMLNTVDPSLRSDCIEALTHLGHRGAALEVARQLPLADPNDDRVAVDYLRRVKVQSTIPEILRALKEAKLPTQIMRYARLIGACAESNSAVAEELLALFDHQKLDREEWAEIARVLGEVAPEGHEPTIDRLQDLLKKGGTGTLELRIAETLRDLGDKKGPETLRQRLIQLTRNVKGKRHYLNWSNLGDFYMAFDDHKEAAECYRKAIKVASGGAVQTWLWLQVARAEAHRKRHKEVRLALENSGAKLQQLEQEAEADAALKEALEHPTVKRYLEKLAEERDKETKEK